MAEFDVQGALDEGYTQKQIDIYLKATEWLNANPDKAGTEEYFNWQELKNPNLNCKELDKNQKKEFRGLCKRIAKRDYGKLKKEWRSHCAILSGVAKSDFAAKKIYETCLDEGGYER